jgi:hypothetical protein
VKKRSISKTKAEQICQEIRSNNWTGENLRNRWYCVLCNGRFFKTDDKTNRGCKLINEIYDKENPKK